MKSFFRKIDVFGGEPCLYIHNHTKYKTISGGIATIIVSIIFFCLILTFSMDLLYKTKPNIRTITTSNSNTSLILNRSDFFLSYVTIDGKGRPFKYEPQFTLKKSYMEHTGSRLINNTSSPEKNEVAFIDCKEEYIQGFDNVSKDIKEVITLYGRCLNLTKNTFYSSPKISPSISQFKLEVFHDVEAIEELYSTVFPYKFYLFYQNIAFDTLNYNQPTKKALGFQKYEILSDTMIVVSAEISILYIDTVVDQLLTEGHLLTKGYGVNSLNAFKNMVQEQENGLRKHLDITLSLSDSTINYVREYPTILDTFSKMGGMIQIILMVAHIVVNILTESEILWYLYNSYFKHKKYKSFHFTQIFNEMLTSYNNITNTCNKKFNSKYLSKLNTSQFRTQSNVNSMMKNNSECKGCMNKFNNSDSFLKYESNLKKDNDNSKVMINPYLQECSISKDIIHNNLSNKKNSLFRSNLSTLKSNIRHKKKEEHGMHNKDEYLKYNNACCLHYCSKKKREICLYKGDPFLIVKEALDINNYFVLADELYCMKVMLLNRNNKEMNTFTKQEKLIERAKNYLNGNHSMQSF